MCGSTTRSRRGEQGYGVMSFKLLQAGSSVAISAPACSCNVAWGLGVLGCFGDSGSWLAYNLALHLEAAVYLCAAIVITG
jgi:hypothetical protein